MWNGRQAGDEEMERKKLLLKRIKIERTTGDGVCVNFNLNGLDKCSAYLREAQLRSRETIDGRHRGWETARCEV